MATTQTVRDDSASGLSTTRATLGWRARVPRDVLRARAADPIDRHFQFAELESRLYRCRDLYDTALAEFDEACVAHDAEMEMICEAFMAKWGKVPLLDTYRQMAFRQQKQGDWGACRWWAERGLTLYGDRVAREDAVEDLLKRRNRALAKINAATRPVRPTSGPTADDPATREQSGRAAHTATTRSAGEIEVLVCSRCEASFERLRVPGRKPVLCPGCRATPRS